MDEKAKRRRQKCDQKAYSNAPTIECRCGCGELIKNRNEYGRNREYVNGHNNRKYEDPKQCKLEWTYRNRESMQKYKIKRQRKRRAKLIRSRGGKCQKCAYKYNGKNAVAFHFHHKNPQTKEFALSSLGMDKSMGNILEELKKCDLLCANCHSIKHGGVKGEKCIDCSGTGSFYNNYIHGEIVSFTDYINIHHNYAAIENHFGKNVWVHRKGATSAKEGQLGIIPGSQGTSSYIVKGKGNPESFMSCSHGAGRKMSRTKAQKELSFEEEIIKLNEKGVIHSIRNKKDLDEASGAYKDIDVVMEEQQDLVDIVVKLEPLAVIKG